MPGSFESEAVVLRSIRYGEADRILHLYTEQRGRVGAMAKGGRGGLPRLRGRLVPAPAGGPPLPRGGAGQAAGRRSTGARGRAAAGRPGDNGDAGAPRARAVAPRRLTLGPEP